MTEAIEHLDSGGERMRLTAADQALLKKGAVITLRDICCDCNLEHLYIWERSKSGDFVERVYRDNVATEKSRARKRKKS